MLLFQINEGAMKKIKSISSWLVLPRYRFWLLLVIFMLILPAQRVKADLGPKPSMHFTFNNETEFIPILSGQQLECEDETCSRTESLEVFGPQGFSCTEDECSSMAYTYRKYHKLVIEFADRTRESNVFTKKAFSANYEVTVTSDALIVKEIHTLGSFFDRDCLCCSGFFSTLVLETLVASIFLGAFQLPKAILGFVPIASLLTLPLVWFAFPLLPISSGVIIALAEITAVLIEAVFIYVAGFRRIGFKFILGLSVIMNVISFGVGLLTI